MAQQSFAGVAVLIALLFAVMALQACASSEQAMAANSGPLALTPPAPELYTPEFHGASIGGDALRSRLSADA